MTHETIETLLITTAAGLSTVLGCLLLFLPKAKNERTMVASLGFAAGIMISVTFTDIIPESLELLVEATSRTKGTLTMVIFLAVGALLAAAIDRLIPHSHTGEGDPNQDLFRTGIVSLLAIMLHKFPEGIAIFMAGHHDLSLGITLAIAISLHNIPEGIAISMPIYHATGKRREAIKYTFIAALAEPLGALLALFVLSSFMTEFMLGIVFALVGGIMLHVAFEELIPASRRYQYGMTSVYATFAGIISMPIASIFVNH